jgi:hypothetical protein
MTAMYRKSRADYPPGILAIYDNGGRTADRYCVVFTPFADDDGWLHYPTLTMSAHPTCATGVGMHGEYDRRPVKLPGDRVIGMADLPAECRRCVEADLRGHEVVCPHCGGVGPELVAAGPHAGERCRVCVSH